LVIAWQGNEFDAMLLTHGPFSGFPGVRILFVGHASERDHRLETIFRDKLRELRRRRLPATIKRPFVHRGKMPQAIERSSKQAAQKTRDVHARAFGRSWPAGYDLAT